MLMTAMSARRAADVSETGSPKFDRRRDWPKAVGALRKLLRDPDDTPQVFEIMRSLEGKTTRRNYIRMLRTVTGARIAYERVELAPRLMDAAWLESFAEGTVGAAYHDFVTRERLSADGLADVSRAGMRGEEIDAPDPVAWFARRVRDTHDLWHILTGYGRDPLGEACLVAFSYAQTHGLGWLLIALGGLVKGDIPGARAAIVQGWRNGRRAAWLPGLDYETVMAMALDDARATLRIAPPTTYRSAIAAFAASAAG